MTAIRNKLITTVLQQEGLDALLVFGLPNIRYLCGFTGTDGVLCISEEETVFMTDSRYVEQAQNQVNADRVLCYKNKLQEIGNLLGDLKCENVGFEAGVVSVALYNDLAKSAEPISFKPLNHQLQALRAKKTAEELSALKAAADLNAAAFNEVFPDIKVGMTERKLSLMLEFALKNRGGEVNAFDFIVASGQRGALPHGVASDKPLNRGELVTIDFGTRVDGYHSDETVTFGMGIVDRNLRQIFDIVLEAHDSAISAVRAGMNIADLDAVARDYISTKGYGEHFGHGLGHGVGLEIHEYPGVSSRSDAVLEEGMVITIEPGIYLPGVGGVRIEDTVTVTADGCDLLTSIPKEYRHL